MRNKVFHLQRKCCDKHNKMRKEEALSFGFDVNAINDNVWATEEDYQDFDNCKNCTLLITTKTTKTTKIKYRKIIINNDEEFDLFKLEISFPASDKEKAEKKLEYMNNLKTFI